ncbi:MAG: SIP domain-containing protein [Acidimicrobiales bacterium]
MANALESKARQRARARLATWAVFVAVLAGWWVTLAPRAFGGPTTWAVVSGTSMLPRYHTGDLVVARRTGSYHIGEVVIVSVDGGHVVHQLYAGDARTGWTTKGINKNAPDLWVIPNRDVLGHAWFMVPNVGNDLHWLGSPGGRLLVAAGLAAFVAAWPRKRQRAAQHAVRGPGSSDRPLSVLLVTSSAGVVAAVVAWTGARTVGLHGTLRVAGAGTPPLYWGHSCRRSPVAVAPAARLLRGSDWARRRASAERRMPGPSLTSRRPGGSPRRRPPPPGRSLRPTGSPSVRCRRACVPEERWMSERSDGRRPVSEENAAAAERLGTTALALEVVAVVDEAPGLRRVTVADPRLSEVDWHPGQDLTLSIPSAGRPFRRRYTIRRLARAAGTADLEALLHRDGPGARWAARVAPGDHLEAVGPRGKIWVDAGSDWHLFVGDDTYLPATFAMVEALPAGTPAIVVLEVGEDVGEQPVETSAAVTGPLWVNRNPVGETGHGVQLIDALADVALPAGSGRAYVGGEHHVVSSVRAALIGRGMPADAISAKAYWRRDKPNQDHGEPERD